VGTRRRQRARRRSRRQRRRTARDRAARVDDTGPAEHRRRALPATPGGRSARRPRAASTEETAFLQIGAGAEAWLIAAAAAGATRLRRKLAEAVDLAKLHGHEHVEAALRAAADAGRFADGDLAAILAHHGGEVIAFPAPANEEQSLQRSTRSWEGFGG
jgi:hypothetical protein